MAEISLNDVSKRYPDGTLAVKNLSLQIADGEFCILVGPSGCGKTTTLNMIAGLEDVTSGDLLIDGEVVNGKPPKDRDIAIVFQSYALYPHMTVRQNMGFALKLAKLPKQQIRDKVEAVAETLGLTEHLDRKPANLSGGQRQRVAMGRAIVRNPKAFLMDEPLSNLDAKLRVQMRTELARLQDQLNVTTVYVTHDQTEAMTLGDRVAVMSEGVLQQSGDPDTLYNKPRNLFVAGFIGSPSMNFVRGTLNGGGVETALGVIELPDRLRAGAQQRGAGRDVVVGFRPENVENASSPAVAERRDGFRFEAQIDVVDSVGSDVFAHFAIVDTGPELGLTADEESGLLNLHPHERELVARFAGSSKIAKGPVALWLDTSELYLFAADSGASLGEQVPVSS